MKRITYSSEEAEDMLQAKIMRGDAGDDVPNMLSQDDSFAVGIRQKTLRETKLEEFKAMPIADWPEHVQRNYYRNKTLIDLWEVPQDIQTKVIEEYEAQAGKNRSKIYGYLVANRLSQHIASIQEF